MNVVVVSGIWPPDPGGPASHAPALADFLAERGHRVEVVTTAVSEPGARAYPVWWAERSSPFRHLRAAWLVRRAARDADAVYATSMIRRSAIGTALARRLLVVKLVSDEVFERAARSGRYPGSLDEFQATAGLRTRFLRATRSWALRRARHVFCPSSYLRDVALGWGLDPELVSAFRTRGLRFPGFLNATRCGRNLRSTATSSCSQGSSQTKRPRRPAGTAAETPESPS